MTFEGDQDQYSSAFMCMQAGRPLNEYQQLDLETFFMSHPEIRALVEDLPEREANNVKWRILDALGTPEGFTRDWEDELHLFFRSTGVPLPLEFYMNYVNEEADPWILHDEPPHSYVKRQRQGGDEPPAKRVKLNELLFIYFILFYLTNRGRCRNKSKKKIPMRCRISPSSRTG